MGCGSSSEAPPKETNQTAKATEEEAGGHFAKQNVTLWTYANGGNMTIPATIYKNTIVEVGLTVMNVQPALRGAIKKEEKVGLCPVTRGGVIARPTF